MDYVVQALCGLVIGIIAKFLMPGRDPGGCIITMLIGIAGSMLFGFLTMRFAPQFATWHWIGGILGAMVILLIYRMIFGESKG